MTTRISGTRAHILGSLIHPLEPSTSYDYWDLPSITTRYMRATDARPRCPACEGYIIITDDYADTLLLLCITCACLASIAIKP
jgi:hypothetical protein